MTVYRSANSSWPYGARGADGFVALPAFMDERPAKPTYDELVSVVAELRSANVQLRSINVELHARVVEFHALAVELHARAVELHARAVGLHARVFELHAQVEWLQRRVGRLEAQLRSRPPVPPSAPLFVKPAFLPKKNRPPGRPDGHPPALRAMPGAENGTERKTGERKTGQV